MAPDDPGLLGNLPKSRPGTRSDKRSDVATSDAERASQRQPAKVKPATAKAKPPTSGPLQSAVRAAESGLRVAEGITREVLRRLPRP